MNAQEHPRRRRYGGLVTLRIPPPKRPPHALVELRRGDRAGGDDDRDQQEAIGFTPLSVLPPLVRRSFRAVVDRVWRDLGAGIVARLEGIRGPRFA